MAENALSLHTNGGFSHGHVLWVVLASPVPKSEGVKCRDIPESIALWGGIEVIGGIWGNFRNAEGYLCPVTPRTATGPGGPLIAYSLFDS